MVKSPLIISLTFFISPCNFPGEWIDVVIEVDVVDLVYKLPDKGKLKVLKGTLMHINMLM